MGPRSFATYRRCTSNSSDNDLMRYEPSFHQSLYSMVALQFSEGASCRLGIFEVSTFF